ncbi:MAG: STAS domain-containing protein [Spirochaetota bacterium]
MKSAARKAFAVMPLAGIGKAALAFEIEEQLSALTAAGQYKAIADLTGIAHISSSVLGVLAKFAEECRSHNGELRLVVTENGVTNLLQVTMLDKVFEIYNSLEEAEEDF